jgi:hypothetical protein
MLWRQKIELNYGGISFYLGAIYSLDHLSSGSVPVDLDAARDREPTARFSVIDPHCMMQTCALTDGFVRTGIIASTYGQVSVNATR